MVGQGIVCGVVVGGAVVVVVVVVAVIVVVVVVVCGRWCVVGGAWCVVCGVWCVVINVSCKERLDCSKWLEPYWLVLLHFATKPKHYQYLILLLLDWCLDCTNQFVQ